MTKFRTLAGVGMFVALAAMTGPAAAIPYANGLTLVVGDKTFTFNTCSIVSSATGSAGVSSCGSLSIVSVINGSGTLADPFFYGFGVNGLIAATAAGGFKTVTIHYGVDAGPGFLISGAHVSQTSSPSASAFVDEVLMNGVTPEGTLHSDGLTPFNNTLTNELVKHLDVTKTYGVTYDVEHKRLIQLSNVDELFSQQPDHTTEGVPEPATLTLFGVGLAGLGLRRRKRT